MKNKNRPYKYNSKSRLTNSNSFPFKMNRSKVDPKKSLENTLTRLKIIEDDSKEIETLDDSFLEGRFDKKDEKKIKKKNIFLKNRDNNTKDKEESLIDSEPQIIKVEDITKDIEESKKLQKSQKEKKDKKIFDFVSMIPILRKVFLSLSAICAIILVVLFAVNNLPRISNGIISTHNPVSRGKGSSNSLDDNYLFVGDFHTSRLVFSEYGLDYHYVNNGESHTTASVLSNMKGNIYDYNPSVIFLELGLLDLDRGVSKNEIINNYKKIVQYIKSNRPNAVIYVESIYPINRDLSSYRDGLLSKRVSNDEINAMNGLLKSFAIENDVQYLDVHSVLVTNGVLNPKYTNNGVYLNRNGYNAVLKEIKKVIG